MKSWFRRWQQTRSEQPVRRARRGPTLDLLEDRTAPAIAYVVAPGQAGVQNFGGSLGMDFDVNFPISISRLGVFDHNSDGINGTLQVQLFNRATTAPLGPTLTFDNGSPGTLVGGSRFKDLATPLVLPAGFQGTIVAWGYNAAELNGNGGPWTTDPGPGIGGNALSFVGSGRYNLTAGAFPANLDGGPANRYAAGTFEYANYQLNAPVSDGTNGTVGTPYVLNLDFANLSSITSYTINWGDGSAPQVVSAPLPSTVSHNYAAVGAYTISATANDSNSGPIGTIYQNVAMNSPSTPLAYYRMDDSPVAVDASGNNQHGFYRNFLPTDASQPGAIVGDTNTSVLFDGVDNHISVPHDPSLAITGDFTAAFWMFKNSEAGDWQRLFGKGDPTTRTFGIWEEGGAGQHILFQQYNAGSAVVNFFSNATVPIGVWTHVAVTVSGSTASIYINGVLDATSTRSGAPTIDAEPLTIGAAPGLHTFFPGRMDEVSLVDRALTSPEIATLHASGGTGTYATQMTTIGAGNLRAYYRLGESSVTGLVDASGNGNLAPTSNLAPSAYAQPGVVNADPGRAIEFDGVDDYAKIPSTVFSTFTSGTPFSMSGWFRTTSGGVIVGQNAAGSVPGGAGPGGWVPGVYVGTDGLLRSEMFWAGGIDPITSTTAVNDGQWHHFATTYSGGTRVLYLDGVAVGSRTGQLQSLYAGASPTAYDYWLGSGYDGGWPSGTGWHFFQGGIDEVAIHATALTPTQARNLYVAGSAVRAPVVAVFDTDFGDAPASYDGTPTSHTTAGAFLGARRDGEAAPQYSPNADGDDLLYAPDDEDGVTFVGGVLTQIGSTSTVQVTASAPTRLDAWLDFDLNGTFGPADQIFTNLPLVAGLNTLNFTVPGHVNPTGGLSFARFRVSSAGGLAFDGPATNGEVEDHAIAISPPQVVALAGGDDIHFTIIATGPTTAEVRDSTAAVVATFDPSGANVVITNGSNANGQILTVDFSGGDPIPVGGIVFNGNLPNTPPGDRLVVANGTFTDVVHNFLGPNSGNLVLVGFGTISYTGLEPVDVTGSTIGNLVLNLPTGGDNASLEDDGVVGNGISRIRSTDAVPTFETFTFSNPSGSLTINDGGAGVDTIALAAMDSLYAPGAVTFNGSATTDVYRLAASQVIPDAATFSLANATLDLNAFNETLGTSTIAGNVTNGAVGTSTLTVAGGTISGSISDGGAGRIVALTKNSAGVLTLGAANTFSGDTRVVAGTLIVNHALALQNSTLNLATADTGTVQFNVSATLGNLVGTRNLDLNGTTLSSGNANASVQYDGTLIGAGNLVKVGSGVWTITGNNTYGGSTTVSGGTLRLGATNRQAYQIAPANTTGNQFYGGSLGYDFTVNAGKPILVTHLGFYDSGLNGLVASHTVRISSYPAKPAWQGKDLAAIADLEKKSMVDVVIESQRTGGARVVSFGMNEEDVRLFMKEPYVATASDGSSMVPNKTVPHPRSYGTFPRKVGRYAIEDGVVPLETAIRSCSGLPADILRLPQRGYVKEGHFADLVVFDPKTFRDTATYDQPHQYATGVCHLFVNGQLAIENGERRPTLAGRVLRHAK